MTKTKARQRAKAKAAEKIKKRLANAEQNAAPVKPGHFDPRDTSILKPTSSGSGSNVAGVKRGAARSG